MDKMAKKDKGFLSDRFGRRISYLRISITDRCNHRCTYCAPIVEKFKKRADILSFDEIVRIVRLMAEMGVTKVRLTGGEPLVRRGVEDLVGMLSEIYGIEDLSMTTNASLLSGLARGLKQKGLRRLNISLDTLKPGLFREISGGGELKPVLLGIDAAIKEGLVPIKFNTVLLRGTNEEELADILDFAADRMITVRFIELMPMSDRIDWKKNYLSIDDVLKRGDIMERVDTSREPERGSTAAYSLPLRSGRGNAGFISPMSNRFCGQCNRMRLTSDGKLRSCLPADMDVDLKAALKAHAGDEELTLLIKKAVSIKPEMGVYTSTGEDTEKGMIHIGG
ncbi:MAG: GTP 3',8-cyclase MoaA [Deltaproteobacteria bacterium]|nr:GTP 3',8-cyclase MoaA [Deltaproteobacteria bacterium]